MFIDEQTNTKIYAELGTAIDFSFSDCLDLYSELTDIIRDTPEYTSLNIPAYVYDEGNSSDYWVGAGCNKILECIDTVALYAPDGYTFSFNSDSELGFWEVGQ